MLVLVRSFSYIPEAGFSDEFVLYSSTWFLMRNFSYTPHASFSEEFLSHSSC